MAIDTTTLTPASIKAKNVATEEYVDNGIANIDVSGDIQDNNNVFAQKLGYTDYAAMVAAASAGNTLISGGYINTGLIEANSITANQINTSGLVAENIHASSTIEGNLINGSVITGAVIKASYLDLDGELEVLTNYHIPTASYNPSTMPDAILVNNEYRLPSKSFIEQLDYNSSAGTPISTSNGYYVATGTELLNIPIYPYDSYELETTARVVKARPDALTFNTDINIGFPTDYTAIYYSEYGTSSTVTIYFGSVVLFTVVFTRISIDACGGYANYYKVYKASVNGVSPANQTCMGSDDGYYYSATASNNGFVCTAYFNSFVGPYGGGSGGSIVISRDYLSSFTSDMVGSSGIRAVVTNGVWPSAEAGVNVTYPHLEINNMI